jgi:hypothetical protein
LSTATTPAERIEATRLALELVERREAAGYRLTLEEYRTALAEGRDLELEAAEAAKHAPKLLSVADIFAPLPPVNWLCQPLDMAPGAPGLIAGYGYSGKSVALQDLALAVASGTRAWGSFDVKHGRVLHLDHEQGSYLTRARYQRLALARGIDPADLKGRLALSVMPAFYLDNDAKDEITRLSDGCDLVVIDSFKASCPSTDENTSEARIPLDRLTRISEQTGAYFLLLHHSRKPSRDRDGLGGARMAIRGSGALYDAAGSVLVFAADKNEPITVAHEKARISGRTHPDFRLHIVDVEIDADPTAGLRVSVLSDAGSGSVDAPDQFSVLKGRILELVRQEGGTLHGGKNLIRAKLGARNDDVRAAVDDLVAAGAIRNAGTRQNPILTLGSTP